MTIHIRRAANDDLPGAMGLLSNAGLPIDDLTTDNLAFVATVGNEIVGVIGFEDHGRVGLLRSLVVAEDSRTAGLGCNLVAALEALAREKEMDELWLLTTDADPYFAQLGYQIRGQEFGPGSDQEHGRVHQIVPG